MKKVELIELLEKMQVPVSEGVPDDENTEAETRICYWEYLWEPLIASSEEYNTNVTYQVSIISDQPRCQTLIKLKNELNKIDKHPLINIEYNIKERRWHSYFSIEVLENVG